MLNHDGTKETEESIVQYFAYCFCNCSPTKKELTTKNTKDTKEGKKRTTDFTDGSDKNTEYLGNSTELNFFYR